MTTATAQDQPHPARRRRRHPTFSRMWHRDALNLCVELTGLPALVSVITSFLTLRPEDSRGFSSKRPSDSDWSTILPAHHGNACFAPGDSVAARRWTGAGPPAGIGGAAAAYGVAVTAVAGLAAFAGKIRWRMQHSERSTTRRLFGQDAFRCSAEPAEGDRAYRPNRACTIGNGRAGTSGKRAGAAGAIGPAQR